MKRCAQSSMEQKPLSITIDNRRERKRGRKRYAGYVAPRINLVPRLRYLSVESKLIFQIEDGGAMRGLLLTSPYQRFNLPCDSFAAERLSRRDAAPSLDIASVDPLIHGRDLESRAMLLHAMHPPPPPHNAYAHPLSLLRGRISDIRLTIQERNIGWIKHLFTETNKVAV